ncbi:MAG: hypothetical protein IT567_07285 [Alphaproteobacteria bacterium]|nr:hypothetical protein [Alphaproteobacteria bacterium]
MSDPALYNVALSFVKMTGQQSWNPLADNKWDTVARALASAYEASVVNYALLGAEIGMSAIGARIYFGTFKAAADVALGLSGKSV